MGDQTPTWRGSSLLAMQRRENVHFWGISVADKKPPVSRVVKVIVLNRTEKNQERTGEDGGAEDSPERGQHEQAVR